MDKTALHSLSWLYKKQKYLTVYTAKVYRKVDNLVTNM